ncbi:MULTISPECIES: ABC transporter permease [Vibrio harveyi group]|uniref:Transport permease protein n=3 Tax=Vibrio parahaemolyticus TaxID=670 RepID=A0A7M1WLG0_VIBPH|nr:MULTISPECIES: ABC transporter permease [Vibrio harveyi group]EGR1577049.1 ABC transporter [Vibrio parahaemolyticus]EGR2182016.1 ABC transporter [Vibrio parahaemolyticus]EGR3371352.1 ABC transporter [Vibrio parahaemolyticus]EHH1171730.1 ABC transporter permease [Vibrio parahaemolyticus]EHJ9988393.1 ABC transporter permease [Vibrio parahaemolyticus]
MAKVLKRSRIQIWGDVIFALFIREIKSGFSDKFGLSWAILNPVSFIFVLSFIRGRMDGGETHTMPTFVFMAYGMIIIQMFLSMWGSSSNAIKRNKSLFAFRQVQPISAFLASGLFEALVKLTVYLTILVMMYFLKMDIQIANPLELLFCFTQISIIALSLGMLFGLAEQFVRELAKVKQLIQRPLFFISGVFFSLQDMPKDFWPYLNWNPVLHAIELSREAVYPTYGAVGVSNFYLGMSTLLLFSLALFSYQAFWKQAISR